MSWKRWVRELHLVLVNTGPLHIGDQDDKLLIDEDSGRAFIPGTSLAGALRAYVESDRDEGRDLAERLFGSERLNPIKHPAALIVHDAFSEEAALQLEQRPGVRIDARLGSVEGRKKFDRLFLPSGLHFRGKLIWMSDDFEELQRFDHAIIKCLQALDRDRIRLGKFKTSGGGQMRVEAARLYRYDLFDARQLFAFLEPDDSHSVEGQPAGENLLDQIRRDEGANDYAFELQVRLTRPLLIRGYGTSDPENPVSSEPDSSPIRDAHDAYIIPASSWKGALRHQCERISRYLGKTGLVDLAFGWQKADQAQQGAVRFTDALIEPDPSLARQEVDYFGIRIDKFTGGVMTEALKQERTLRGTATLRLRLSPVSSVRESEAAIAGLLVMALRDLAEQGFALGSGSGTGRGFVTGETLDIRAPEGVSTIQFRDRHVTNPELIEKWIAALHSWEPADTANGEAKSG